MLIALAREPEGEFRSAAELALSQKVPYALARGILSHLAHCGLVLTRRGAGGGVALARPSDQISALSIIECIEGPVSLGLCTTDPEYCNQVGTCLMHGTWKEAEAQLRVLLAGRSLAYLAAETNRGRLHSTPAPRVASEEVRPT